MCSMSTTFVLCRKQCKRSKKNSYIVSVELSSFKINLKCLNPLNKILIMNGLGIFGQIIIAKLTIYFSILTSLNVEYNYIITVSKVKYNDMT